MPISDRLMPAPFKRRDGSGRMKSSSGNRSRSILIAGRRPRRLLYPTALAAGSEIFGGPLRSLSRHLRRALDEVEHQPERIAEVQRAPARELVQDLAAGLPQVPAGRVAVPDPERRDERPQLPRVAVDEQPQRAGLELELVRGPAQQPEPQHSGVERLRALEIRDVDRNAAIGGETGPGLARLDAHQHGIASIECEAARAGWARGSRGA